MLNKDIICNTEGNKLTEFCERNVFEILNKIPNTLCMELNNGGSMYVCIETVYFRNLV
jgi:hypothetical protein